MVARAGPWPLLAAAEVIIGMAAMVAIAGVPAARASHTKSGSYYGCDYSGWTNLLGVGSEASTQGEWSPCTDVTIVSLWPWNGSNYYQVGPNYCFSYSCWASDSA